MPSRPGAGIGEARHKTGEETINVFIPTTPNPTSGIFLIVPRREVVESSMSVDDGLKLIVSSGVVVPESSRSGSAKEGVEVAPSRPGS